MLPDGVRMMKLSFTNIFFIPCDGGYLQIDTSYPGYYEEYLEELKKLGIEPSEIKYLLLTHHHDDHSGFVVDLLEKNPETILIVHKNALEGLSSGASVEDSRPVNTCVKILVGKIFSRFHKFVFAPCTLREGDIVLDGEDGSLLHSIGIDGTIIYTPGHSNDSISILLSDGSAFVGDIAMDFLNICNCRHLPIYITDVDEVYESWDNLKAHGAKTIYTSHGKPFGVEELNPVE
ncbi:MAG: MBL fold metallo-hydrolase [Deltaproteobacteria bacterium]|nr:MBL fold metallo-hydrolase [Candidatus Zymogenaceae bacterium]